MRIRTRLMMACMYVLTAGLMSGCDPNAPGGGGGAGGQSVEVPFDLGAGLGDLEVTAGEPTTVRGEGRFSLTGASAGGGTLKLSISDITVTPSDATGGKGTAAFQAGGTLEITVWIDALDALETVCGGGEQYGPYDIELDENYVPVSIAPDEITLTPNTLALLNGGEFSLCIQVVSPVSGQVRIGTLTFEVTPGPA